MEAVRLETGRLRDIDERWFYGATCSACGHAARLSVRKLQQFLGEDFPLTRIRPRLRCEKCGNRQCVVTFLAPDRLAGGLVNLDDRRSR